MIPLRQGLSALALLLLGSVERLPAAVDTGTPGQNTHRIAGIGIAVANDEPNSRRIHKYILVRFIQDHSPALKVGLRAGDEIIAVDDFRLARQDFLSVVEDRLRGEQDSVVQVTVVRIGFSQPLTFTLVRKIIPAGEPARTSPAPIS